MTTSIFCIFRGANIWFKAICNEVSQNMGLTDDTKCYKTGQLLPVKPLFDYKIMSIFKDMAQPVALE
jgi:hypothetical protein